MTRRRQPVRQQPKNPGVVRVRAKLAIHEEVLQNLLQISQRERRSLSWVIAEIVYDYFGLKIDKDTVRVLEARMRRAHAGQVLKFRRRG